MKKFFLPILLALTLSACTLIPQVVEEDEEEEIVEEVDEEETKIKVIEEVVVELPEGITELDAAEHIDSFEEHYKSLMPDYTKGDENDFEKFKELIVAYNKYYEIFIFDGGPYQGQSLVSIQAICNGLCPSGVYRFAVDFESNSWVLLEPYSDETTGSIYLPPISSTDSQISIPELDIPETLDVYENDNVVLAEERSRILESTLMELTQNGIAEETSIPGVETAYLYSNCIYTKQADTTFARYAIVPDSFLTDEGFSTTKEVTFTSNDGGSVTKPFAATSSKCGFSENSCLNQHTPDEGEEESLELRGTLDGNEVWMFKSDYPAEGHTGLSAQASYLYSSYASQTKYNTDEEPMSMEEYFASDYIFFIKMDTGNYVVAYDLQYAPQAECGKPVIYLYPEKTTEVSVVVNEIDFTITIPEHNDGWNVIAQPNGKLTNLADGKQYPYLFWEGNSDKSIALDPGFTLKRKEVITKLPGMLYQMGLNWKETYDFMEFWAPRLMAEKTPYIEFNFVDENLFDQVAPLSVEPTPDTMIRLFMIYKGVNEAGLPVPNFVRPERNGFTLVEWGGALY